MTILTYSSQQPQKYVNCSFANTTTSGLDTDDVRLICTGSGQTVAQTNGNLVITAGTTANAETIIRSTFTAFGALRLTEQTTLSQRIVNNSFVVELVDVLGDGLPYSITNSTTVVVTYPSPVFSAKNVGQVMRLGNITGAAGVPILATIASVSGNDVTYTVSGWPASGTGTLSVFGWNAYELEYTGTTATNVTYRARRNGRQNVADTTATISTTASPGHLAFLNVTDGASMLLDGLAATTTGIQTTPRASRLTDLPNPRTNMFAQIRVLNGTTAPASTTTWTVGLLRIEDYVPSEVTIVGVEPQSNRAALPVQVLNTPTVDTEMATAAALADGVANPTTTTVGAAGLLFNGTTFDRQRANNSLSVEASSAKTATGSGTAQVNYNAKGVILYINVSAASGTTPTLVVNVQAQDPVTSNWITIPGASTASLTGITAVQLAVYPGVTVAANTAVSYPLPRNWRVSWTIGGTTPSFTFSVGAQYIL